MLELCQSRVISRARSFVDYPWMSIRPSFRWTFFPWTKKLFWENRHKWIWPSFVQSSERSVSFSRVTFDLSFLLKNGFVHGIIHVLLLNMSASLTRQLGMAPGGEFRAAFREVHSIDPSKNRERENRSHDLSVFSGPKTIHQSNRARWSTRRNNVETSHEFSVDLEKDSSRFLTAQLTRANNVSSWEPARLQNRARSAHFRSDDVEKFKEKDLLEQVLEEMSDQYPELCRVFVKERDLYLAYSLNKCLQSIPVETTSTGFVRPTVVAVVGIGHLPGIVEQWNRSIPDNVDDLLRTSVLLPFFVRSMTNCLTRFSFRGDDERRPTQSNRRSFCSTSLKILSLGSICLFIFYLNRCRFRSLKMWEYVECRWAVG